MMVKVLVTQLYLTLWHPRDYSPPGSFVQGILQARILEWVAISFSRRSSWPRNWTQVSFIAGRIFTVWATRNQCHQNRDIFLVRSAGMTLSIVRLVSGFKWSTINYYLGTVSIQKIIFRSQLFFCLERMFCEASLFWLTCTLFHWTLFTTFFSLITSLQGEGK